LLFGATLLLVIAAGCFLFIFKPVWFPLPITSAAFAYDRQFTWTLWVSSIIFIAVHLLLIWTLARRRRSLERSPSGSHRRLEISWIAATGVLFIVLSVLGSRGWARTSTGPAGKEVIEVHAHQFAWSFRYPGPDGLFGRTDIKFISDSGGNPVGIDPKDSAGKDDITASTLRIPASCSCIAAMSFTIFSFANCAPNRTSCQAWRFHSTCMWTGPARTKLPARSCADWAIARCAAS